MIKKITVPAQQPTPAPAALKSRPTPKTPLAKEAASEPVERVQPDLLGMYTAKLRRGALAWHNPDNSPRRDVADYRAFIRFNQLTWPTVLTLSPTVFEDLINHPDVIAFLCSVQLERSYDVRHPAQAAQLLASWFGVKSISISADEPSASLS